MSESARVLAAQRRYFATGATLPTAFRRAALRRLLNAVTARKEQILDALHSDLGKAPMEGYLTEVGLVKSEIADQLRHLERWSRPRCSLPPLAQFPALGRVLPEPYGAVLILSPWNYPFLLSVSPLAGALAAGNCALLKPATAAPATAAVLQKLIADVFSPAYVHVLSPTGDSHEEILRQQYDYILFTGSQRVGRVVMAAAAEHLTPVTLELGGKSPCIVEESADLALAARRIAFGKFLNAGQTCVAPDHVYVQRTVAAPFLAALKTEISRLYGADPLRSPDLPHIVSRHHFDRLCGLMTGETIVCGGSADADSRRIAPTVLAGVSPDAPVMAEEIFGPILPVLVFDTVGELIARQQALPKPLALYLFTRDRAVERRVLGALSFGGGCVNDTVVHLACGGLPFGGVGASGMGAYHGRASFDTFTHYKSVLKKSNLLDIPVRYAPYTEGAFALAKKLIR